MTTTRTVDVEGARLYYELRGSGPLLVVTGSPMDAAAFAPLADALATSHTVLTHDPRGISHSALADPSQESTPHLRAMDLVALLDALGADSADVFGTSGGALTGLSLAASHPERVRTLIAHEPPMVTLLPDASELSAKVDEIVATFRRDGQQAAWPLFMEVAGYVGDPDGDEHAEEPDEPSLREIENGARFLGHELRASASYAPDIRALADGRRVVIGVGADSGPLLTHRTSLSLATALGLPMVEFPGEHTGFLAEPEPFAAVVRRVLAGE